MMIEAIESRRAGCRRWSASAGWAMFTAGNRVEYGKNVCTWSRVKAPSVHQAVICRCAAEIVGLFGLVGAEAQRADERVVWRNPYHRRSGVYRRAKAIDIRKPAQAIGARNDAVTRKTAKRRALFRSFRTRQYPISARVASIFTQAASLTTAGKRTTPIGILVA